MKLLVVIVLSVIAAAIAAPIGALITLDHHSTVGVLLDEFTGDALDIVKNAWLEADDETWISVAKDQVGHTSYLNSWRMYSYDYEKLQLPPPPKSRFRINLTSDPYEFSFGTHSYIARDYHYYFVYVTNQHSINASEPELVPVGGSWSETRIVPIDPLYTMQRTGYDCLDEAEFPIGSPDTYNAADTFFDPDCEAEGLLPEEITSYSYHRTPYKGGYPVEDCITTLEREVGYIEVEQTWVHIPWDDEIADEWRWGAENQTYKATPDLLPVVGDLSIQRIKYSYGGGLDPCAEIEGCLTPGWRRLLTFDASTTNVGLLPVHIGYIGALSGNPPPGAFVGYEEEEAEQMVANNVYEYSGCHGHYHFQFYSQYSVESVNGTKLAWCLESVNRIYNDEYTDFSSPYWVCAYQGITTGWADQYIAGIPCQWIDITDATPSSTAQLSFEINPEDFICEGSLLRHPNNSIQFEPTPFVTQENDLPINRPLCNFTEGFADNNVQTAIAPIPPEGSFIMNECAVPLHSPLRDCSWIQLAWNEGCRVPGGIERFAIRGDQDLFVWRLCETSQVLKTGTWCSHMDALAWGIGSLDFGDEVEFTCPTYRDPTEPGGAFAIYVGRFSPLDKTESYVTAAEFLVSGEERRVGNGTLPSRSKKDRSWIAPVAISAAIFGVIVIIIAIAIALSRKE